MLRIDRDARRFIRLRPQSMTGADLTERQDIQQMILQSPEILFEELGERLLLIGEEIRPPEFVADRIDILAIDENGVSVIIELKRGSHKLQLLQALAYAGMVSQWRSERLIDERAKSVRRPRAAVEDEVEEFLAEGVEKLNESQRVILIAEDFDYEVLVAANGLTIITLLRRRSLAKRGRKSFSKRTMLRTRKNRRNSSAVGERHGGTILERAKGDSTTRTTAFVGYAGRKTGTPLWSLNIEHFLDRPIVIANLLRTIRVLVCKYLPASPEPAFRRRRCRPCH